MFFFSFWVCVCLGVIFWHSFIPMVKVLSFLTITLVSLYFTVNNKFYIQVDGAAMGFPLGPILTNSIFHTMKNSGWINVLQNLIQVYIKRYVDDIFVFEAPESAQLFHECIYSKHQDINFTNKHENIGSFSFLGIKICRKNGKLITSIYRKSTFCGVFTMKFHSKVQKEGTFAYISS